MNKVVHIWYTHTYCGELELKKLVFRISKLNFTEFAHEQCK